MRDATTTRGTAPPHPAVVALATDWSADLDAVATRVFDHLASRIPRIREDRQLADLTLASCLSNVEAIVTMLRYGIPASAAEAPVGGVEHARAMAQRGAEVDETLHFYRVGIAALLEDWSAGLRERIGDRDELVAVLGESTAFCLGYIDVVSSKMSAAHLTERELQRRRDAGLREELVRALLHAEAVDVVAAERALGHPLGGPQLALLCTTEHDVALLERAAVAIARAFDAARPLVVEEEARRVAVWIAPQPSSARRWRRLERELAARCPGVRVAAGGVGVGPDGFRESHREARRAARIAAMRVPPTPLTRYEDCALVDLLSQDVEAAAAFVRRELGGLAGGDPRTSELRRTLLEVVRPRGGIAVAARTMDVHRNTVVHRIGRAEALRGAPIDVRAAELHAALLLDALLPR